MTCMKGRGRIHKCSCLLRTAREAAGVACEQGPLSLIGCLGEECMESITLHSSQSCCRALPGRKRQTPWKQVQHCLQLQALPDANQQGIQIGTDNKSCALPARPPETLSQRVPGRRTRVEKRKGAANAFNILALSSKQLRRVGGHMKGSTG